MGISDWFQEKFQDMGDISPMGASNLGVSKYVYMNNVDQNSKQGLPRGLALMDYYKNVPGLLQKFGIQECKPNCPIIYINKATR